LRDDRSVGLIFLHQIVEQALRVLDHARALDIDHELLEALRKLAQARLEELREALEPFMLGAREFIDEISALAIAWADRLQVNSAQLNEEH